LRGITAMFNLVLMPIGAYDPRWIMEPVHLDPEEAVRARAAWGAARLPDDRLWVMAPGETRLAAP